MSPRTVGLVGDLMDRSRLGSLAGIVWAATPEDPVLDGADTVVIDLAAHGSAIRAVRALAPGAFIVAFGSHVDRAALAGAREAGADRVLPRSRFFADPEAALARDEGTARA